MQLLYALGVVILLVLLWQAVTWFTTYRRSLRLKLEPVPPAPDIEINPNPELGKVRVRPRLPDAAAVMDSNMNAAATPPESVGDQAREPQTTNVILSSPAADGDDNIPVLLSPVALNPATPAIVQQDMFAHEAIAPPPAKKHDYSTATSPSVNRASILYETPVVEPVRPVPSAVPEEKTHVDVQDVIAMHVVCDEQPFNGEDLLRAILNYGLRFGEMAIFHRHEQPTGQGRILFSMAKAVEPGTFDLEAMTGETVPGVSFFLSLPGVNSIHAYDIMADTVKRLATEMQGRMLDEQQQPLTRQLIEHYRERVQEFERRRLTIRPSR